MSKGEAGNPLQQLFEKKRLDTRTKGEPKKKEGEAISPSSVGSPKNLWLMKQGEENPRRESEKKETLRKQKGKEQWGTKSPFCRWGGPKRLGEARKLLEQEKGQGPLCEIPT